VHVGLNLIFLVPGETGGMEVAARELVPALARAAPEVRFTAFVGRDAAGLDLGVDRVVLPLSASDRVQWVRGEQLVLPRAAARLGCDVVHSLASTAPGTGPFRRVATIHDLNYLMVPEAHFGVRALGMRVLVPLAARRSHRVITGSANTRDDLVGRLGVAPERIDVVPHGLGRPAVVAPTPPAELRRRLELGARRVLLCLSAKRPHKNLAALLDALARIPAERRPVAVLAGYRTPYEAELRRRAEELGVAADVRFPDWLPDADVEGLFGLADVFAYPSLYEGFGLPVLEAMARGVPVACSRGSSLTEVAGDAALLFDPGDVEDMRGAIERLLGDEAERERLRAAGRARAATFTWERTARLTLESYGRVLAPAA
jgi:glycosyltransferase involved in cell wall biosynthesis